MSDDPCRLGELQTRVAVLERAFELRHDGLQLALRLQAAEYERRLGDLNGEAIRLQKMQETFLSRDVYEVQHRALSVEVEELRHFKDYSLGRQSIIMATIALVVSVAVAFITHGMWNR